MVAVNALVGAMAGQERTVPLLAEREFGISGYTVSLAFILVFGLVKAVTNLASGVLSDDTAASRSSSPAGSSGCPCRCC